MRFFVHSTKKNKQAGFTLIEVLIAIAVTAIIASMAAYAFNSADVAQQRTKANLQKMQRLDRAWLSLETDLRNALGKIIHGAYGDAIPAMLIDETAEEWLTFLRGGRANPLHFYRSELGRVQYYVEDGVLSRRLWNDPAQMDEDLAHVTKLLDGIEEIEVRVLPPGAGSVQSGPWVDDWPPPQALAALPRALEITITLEEGGEMTRLFALVPGI